MINITNTAKNWNNSYAKLNAFHCTFTITLIMIIMDFWNSYKATLQGLVDYIDDDDWPLESWLVLSSALLFLSMHFLAL